MPDDYNNQKMRVCRYEVVATYNSDKEIDPSRVPLIDKSTERAIRKNGAKVHAQDKKETKNSAKAELQQVHLTFIEELKTSKPGGTINLSRLTAGEVIEVVYSLIGDNEIASMDRKNKKSIVKKASALLTAAGFIIAVPMETK